LGLIPRSKETNVSPKITIIRSLVDIRPNKCYNPFIGSNTSLKFKGVSYMNIYEKEQVERERNYLVTKSNQIVQKSRYNFSVAEQRAIAYICSLISPVEKVDNSELQLEYTFNILEYARVCGIEQNGKFYNEVKSTLKNLHDKSMWLTLPDGSETTVSWLAKATISSKSGLAKIELDKDLVPYLFDLKNKFLSYGLKNILNMKSQYSIRMYELLRSHHDMRISQTDKRTAVEREGLPQKTTWTIDLDELKKTLMVDNIKTYDNFKDFRKKVLEVAQKEINALTDTSIYFEPITKGRKVIKIKFSIVRKAYFARISADHRNDLLLGDPK